MTSNLSDDQRAEIRTLIAESSESVFVEKHSNAILSRVWKVVTPAILGFLGFLAWLGWDSYENIKDEVALQISKEAAGFVADRSTEIENLMNRKAEEAAQSVLADEINKITMESLEPKLQRQVRHFETRLESISDEAIKSITQDFVDAFPAIMEIQKLGEDGIRTLNEKVSTLEDERLHLWVQVNSQSSTLNDFTNKFKSIQSEVQNHELEVTELKNELDNVTLNLNQLRDDIEKIDDTISATRDICNLFRAIPVERFKNVFGEPPPEDDPELPYRIETSINQILYSCID